MRARFAVLLLALAGVAAPAAAAPRRDWTQVAAPAAAGSFVIGNPQARVKLVEFASYTCPHCRHFAEQSRPVLTRMIRSGSLSLEIRNALHDKLDLAAAILARCVGPAAFPRFHDALYANQDDWFARGAAWDQGNAARMQLYPEAARLRALADGAGLSALARASGLDDAALDRCFTDPAATARALAVAQGVAQRTTGTPAFLVNGRFIQNVDWAKLEPALRAAGAKE
jgi:protein-disulfide isomerase